MTMVATVRKAVTYNPGTKLISIVIAVLLWFVVLGSRNVEVSKEVPLEIVTPSDAVIANEAPDRVVFRLVGPKAFLRTILDRRDDPIRVDLSSAKPGTVTYRFFSDNIRLPIGVKVQSIHPASVVLNLEELKFKKVPVRVDIQGVPPEGFSVLETTVEPAEVSIKGAKSRVAAIRDLRTNPIDVTGVRKTVEKPASFDMSRVGVAIDGGLPVIKVRVAATSANFKIKNVPIRVKTDLRHRLKVREVTVYVRASSEDLARLDESQVSAEVDLSGKGKGYHEPEVIIKVPDPIAFVKVVPERVPVTIY